MSGHGGQKARQGRQRRETRFGDGCPHNPPGKQESTRQSEKSPQLVRRSVNSFLKIFSATDTVQDWNGGKISFYTTPPAGPKSSRIAAEVVSTWGADFDIDAIIAAENKHLMETLPCSSAADQAKFATAEAVEEEGMVDDDSFLKSEEEEGDQETANDDQGEKCMHVKIRNRSVILYRNQPCLF